MDEEAVSKNFNKRKIKVDGTEVEIDIAEELTLSSDIDADMRTVVAKMGFWGSVWAAAESESQRIDASYRKWRGTTYSAILDTKEGAKFAEWKIKHKVESETTFQKFKDAHAIALDNAIFARSLYEAFRTKAGLLQSRGAMARAELEKTGISTKVKVATDKEGEILTKAMADATDEDKTARMRTMFKKKG
jgi:hypothetical protein